MGAAAPAVGGGSLRHDGGNGVTGRYIRRKIRSECGGTRSRRRTNEVYDEVLPFFFWGQTRFYLNNYGFLCWASMTDDDIEEEKKKKGDGGGSPT